MVGLEMKDRIIVPVDTNDIDKALELVETLRPHVGMFKFGLELLNTFIVQLVTSNDNTLIEKVRNLFKLTQGKLFWDGKWDDISNTIAGAATALAPLEPKMVNVHASAGIESIKAAVKNTKNGMVLGVTVLTCINDDECITIFGADSDKMVGYFADMILDAGAQGIICSPKELITLNKKGVDLIKVTPGVRPIWASTGDQKRVMTPAGALMNGADYLVIGRPITNPPLGIGSPVEAVQKIVEEMEISMKS